MDWFCGHCKDGNMRIGEIYCTTCGRKRDVWSIPPPPPPPFRGQRRQGSSASFSAAGPSKVTAGLSKVTAGLRRSIGEVDISSTRPTSEGVSPKSDVTSEETSILLLERSKHAHRPSEPEVPLEVPIYEAQNNRELDKSAITADEILITEKSYEQCIADDVLRGISGDTEASGPSSDPESDLDSLRGPILEPETGDRSSDNPDRSEGTRAKLKRGLLVPPVIYMLFVRVCGIVTRLFEPNPLPGTTRIRWRCQCGQMLYDDFIEFRHGALADLEKELNATTVFYECTPSSSSASSYASNTRDRTSPGGWLEHLRWPWTTAKAQSPSLPLQQRQDALNRVSTQLPPNNERRGLCIFLCIPYHRTAAKLYPWVVEKISTDNALFSTLRSLYKTAREEHVSFLSLRTLQSIRFVRFEVYSQRLVDVRMTPDMPDESRRDEYSYEPTPAEFLPPIGENHMMHLYRCPEDAEYTGICLSKIPKKTEGLAWLPVHPQGCKIGWGLQFVEGLDVMKLWVSGFIGFIISIMFGIAWSMIKDDMQSGFAVAACMLTGLLFTSGLIQAAYAPR